MAALRPCRSGTASAIVAFTRRGVLAARRRLTSRSHTEPALRIPNYKECVAEKGHEACANLLPFFQWLYEHGIDVAA